MSLIVAKRELRQGPQWYPQSATLDMMTRARLLPAGWSGVSVTPAVARTVPSVWSSLQLTAGVISTLPLAGYRMTPGPNCQKTIMANQPRLLTNPSGDTCLEDWLYQVVESMIMHGAAVGEMVDFDANMKPTQIELVDVDTVYVRTDPVTKAKTWKFGQREVPTDRVWVLSGIPKTGSPFGRSLIDYASEHLGLGVAARRYGSQFFGDGGHPLKVLRPLRDPGDDGARKLKDKVLDAIRGNREPLVLSKEVELEDWIRTPPGEAMLVEVLRQNANDVAQFFLVPPELVGSTTGDSATYSNVESRVLQLLTFGVNYWMVKVERALTRLLPRPQCASFDEMAIVRSEIKTAAEVDVMLVRGGIETPAEARDHRMLPRIGSEHEDELLWPPFLTGRISETEVAPAGDTPLDTTAPSEGEANGTGRGEGPLALPRVQRARRNHPSFGVRRG